MSSEIIFLTFTCSDCEDSPEVSWTPETVVSDGTPVCGDCDRDMVYVGHDTIPAPPAPLTGFAAELQSPRYLDPVNRFRGWIREYSVTVPDPDPAEPDFDRECELIDELVTDWVNSTHDATVEDFDLVTEWISHCGFPYPPLPTVSTFLGHDGIPVVQIDTATDTGPIRVNVNDAPVYHADPETNSGPIPNVHTS